MVLAQNLAATLAAEFNKEVRLRGSYVHSLRQAVPSVSVLPCSVFRLRDETVSGGFRYLSAEPFLDGEFIKFNSNNGYVEPSGDLGNLVAQAFSHWSYEYSVKISSAGAATASHRFSTDSLESSGVLADVEKEPLLVCDIQGTDFCFTDPSVCTTSGHRFGKADVGQAGITRFFERHDCNAVCSHLRLFKRHRGSHAIKSEK